VAVRDIYLRIEAVHGYSPAEPDDHVSPPIRYRRDCMRSPGHEDGTVPDDEVAARSLTALVYREYLDRGYLVPKPDKLVAADINEPAFAHRVPGAVLYARPGERLRIHVRNDDTEPHSFHLHGLRHGVDSDGTWPLGTQSADRGRSDEISPGHSWTHTYEIGEDRVGAWPFHDHCRQTAPMVDRGLFGGLIVLSDEEHADLPRFPYPPRFEEYVGDVLAELGERATRGVQPPPELATYLTTLDELAHAPQPVPAPEQLLHVPLFVHRLSGARATPVFHSGPMVAGGGHTSEFTVEGSYAYTCGVHGAAMAGSVTVVPGGPGTAEVRIVDFAFDPADVTVGIGGQVTWTNHGPSEHDVLESGGDSIPSYCFNGRSFAGNTPTIVARAGQRIRWYVFDLDFGTERHTLRTHAGRWQSADQVVDVRSIGPAESFVAETVAPPVLLPPAGPEDWDRPRDGASEYTLRGDFLVDGHLELQGLAALVRSYQTVHLTDDEARRLEATVGLPLDPGDNDCPAVQPDRSAAAVTGQWQELRGLPGITFMHAVLLPHTNRILFWGHGPRADQTRIWDQHTGAYTSPANQPQAVTPDQNIWSGAHAHLADAAGTVLAHGGYHFNFQPPLTSRTERRAFLFDWATARFAVAAQMHRGRFYPTTLTLPDGRPMTLFGQENASPGAPTVASAETFTPGGIGRWSAPEPLPFNYFYYPWTFLLPGGDLFIAGPQKPARRYDPTVSPVVDDPALQYEQIAVPQRGVNMDGTAVLLPLKPPHYEARVLVAGGTSRGADWSSGDAGALRTAEWIDLSVAAPAWRALPDMNVGRDKMNSVLLPDGRVLMLGGVGLPSSGGPVDIFDPSNPAAGFQLGPTMRYRRGYHSAALLLPDGSVIVGGDPNGATTPNERYLPSYFSSPRPVVTAAPASITYGAAFAVQTPTPTAIAEVVLMRPAAVTHGFNQNQRYVGCVINGTTAAGVDVTAPPDGTIAPPGYYILFLLDTNRIPSTGVWIRLVA
jgi:plastocyanin